MEQSNIEIILPNVRADWNDLFVAKATKSNPTGNKRYSLTAIFAPTHPAAETVAAAIRAAAVARHGAAAEVMLGKWKATGALPLKDGNTVLQGDKINPNYAGMLFIRANRSEAKGPPLVLGSDAKPLSALNTAERIYRGCYVNLKVQVYGWKSPDAGENIYIGLEAVQYNGPGDAFTGGGAAPSADGFNDVSKTARPQTGGAVPSSLAGLV